MRKILSAAARDPLLRWVEDQRRAGIEKIVFKGFVHFTGSCVALFFQPLFGPDGTPNETSHKDLIKNQFPQLSETSGGLAKGVYGFQLRFNSTTAQYNPASNHFGTMENPTQALQAWQEISRNLNLTPYRWSIAVKSKKIAPAFSGFEPYFFSNSSL